jgi:hypothetical protein
MYTPVRHVPIDPDAFSFYGVELENFDAVPTWAYATPHNIQRITPQTESCLSCHENDDVFLTADAVAPEERGANAGVIVESAPPMPEGFENVITGQEDAAPVTDETDSGDDGGFWGDEPADDADDSSSDDAGFWGDEDDSSDETDDASSDDADGFWGDEDDTSDDTDDASSDDADGFWGDEDDSSDETDEDTSDDDDFWNSN